MTNKLKEKIKDVLEDYFPANYENEKLADQILSTLSPELELLIAKEINICRSEGQATSRLTSLALAVKELLK